MAEEKDSGIRITDRRKFNPDGTPRDHVDEIDTPASPPASEPPPAPAEQSDNVISFPGDAARQREPEAPPAEPPAAETPAAEARAAEAPDDARAAQARAAASAAEQAYNQTRGPQSPHLPEASD